MQGKKRSWKKAGLAPNSMILEGKVLAFGKTVQPWETSEFFRKSLENFGCLWIWSDSIENPGTPRVKILCLSLGKVDRRVRETVYINMQLTRMLEHHVLVWLRVHVPLQVLMVAIISQLCGHMQIRKIRVQIETTSYQEIVLYSSKFLLASITSLHLVPLEDKTELEPHPQSGTSIR